MQTAGSKSDRLGSSRQCAFGDKPNAPEHWSDQEIDEAAFQDARLGRRCHELIRQMGGGMGESILLACQDRANTKAAYQFFANERVHEGNCQRPPCSCRYGFAAMRARACGQPYPQSYADAGVSSLGSSWETPEWGCKPRDPQETPRAPLSSLSQLVTVISAQASRAAGIAAAI